MTAVLRAVCRIAPNCIVYGFEANLNIYAKPAETMAAQGSDWRNLAVSDKSARVSVFAPRTLSQAYINGQRVPAEALQLCSPAEKCLCNVGEPHSRQLNALLVIPP